MPTKRASQNKRDEIRQRILELLVAGRPCYDVADAINAQFAVSLTPKSIYMVGWRYGILRPGSAGPSKRIPAAEQLALGEQLRPGSTADDVPVAEIVRLEKVNARLLANYHILQGRHKELLRTSNLADAIRETVRGHIEALPPIEPPKLLVPDRRGHVTRETWCPMFSDLHWGELVRPEEVLGMNWYDKDTATRRCEVYVEVQADLVLNHLQGYCFEDAFLFALGDNVAGEIHEELRETNIGPTFDHIFGVVLIYVQMIREMLSFLPRIVIRFTDDNHGRWFQKKRAKQRYVNHSIEIAHIVSALFRDEPRVEIHLEESPFALDEIRGNWCLSMHGDTFRSWNGIPDYGIERGDMRLSQLLGAHGKAYKYMLLSHFHTEATRARAVGQRIMNGCVIGGDEYALTAMHSGTSPSQTVFGMHQRGRTFLYDVDLTTPLGEMPHRWTYDFRPQLGEAYGRATETTADWLQEQDWE